MENRDLNRLKVVLAEKKRTNRWLAAELFRHDQKLCVIFFVSLHKTIPPPPKKKDEGNLRRHTLVYRY